MSESTSSPSELAPSETVFRNATSWQDRSKADLPPMLKTYIEYKEQYPDTLLLMQVGDFYETFFDDASIVAKALNLTLTSRDKRSEDPIPMAGVPLAVVDTYVERLTGQGYSVAIVSQKEPASQAKGMVARGLDRIVTPGINIFSESEGNLPARPIVSFVPLSNEENLKGDSFAGVIAYSFVEQAEVFVREIHSFTQLMDELQRLQAIELIVPKLVHGSPVDRRKGWIQEISRLFNDLIIKFRSDSISMNGTQRELATIEGFGQLDPILKRVVRLLIMYVDETTVEVSIPLSRISRQDLSSVVSIDMMTRRNLDLVQNSRDGSTAGTLVDTLDRTKTKAGQAVLRNAVLNPLVSIEEIQSRQKVIGQLVDAPLILESVRELLSGTVDVARIASRIELGIVGVREIVRLRSTLATAPVLEAKLRELTSLGDQTSELLECLRQDLSYPAALKNLLEGSLHESAGTSSSDLGLFEEGYDSELDQLRDFAINGKQQIVNLENSYREQTGISSLKIKHNNVLGYFVEVTKTHASKIDAPFIKKQSTTNASRYFTDELKDLEERVSRADSEYSAREDHLFFELREALRSFVPGLRSTGRALAQLDFFSSLSSVAISFHWTCPTITSGNELVTENGRHPVMEAVLRDEFVPNSLALGKDLPICLVVTGPNMGGKSTYLRQAALIVILAQMGSFVPAKSATIGLVDKIFARIGASDNLLEGESTFMVEMREASHILRQASHRSLVLIDEIGRGTATVDGLAIAQSILEYLLQAIRCRTLFATHFHELAKLEEVFQELGNCSVTVVEHGDNVCFTHEIRAGAANKSYGLEVATLAGLPQAVLQRAQSLFSVYEVLESARGSESRMQAHEQITLFSKVDEYEKLTKDLRDEVSLWKEVQACLEDVDPNNITPIMALQLLVDLKKRIQE